MMIRGSCAGNASAQVLIRSATPQVQSFSHHQEVVPEDRTWHRNGLLTCVRSKQSIKDSSNKAFALTCKIGLPPTMGGRLCQGTDLLKGGWAWWTHTRTKILQGTYLWTHLVTLFLRQNYFET
eukprot:4049916-Amphidinium_carterae.1